MADEPTIDAPAPAVDQTPTDGAPIVTGTTDAETSAQASADASADGTTEPESTAGAPTPKAPEKYDLSIPEGAQALIDENDLEYLQTEGRKADLSNDQLQAVLDNQVATLSAMSERYRNETMADPTYGGAHLVETQRLANLVINKIRPEGHASRDSFLKFLAKGGANNALPVVSFLADIGRLMAEDSPGLAPSASGTPRDAASVMFAKSLAQLRGEG